MENNGINKSHYGQLSHTFKILYIRNNQFPTSHIHPTFISLKKGTCFFVDKTLGLFTSINRPDRKSTYVLSKNCLSKDQNLNSQIVLSFCKWWLKYRIGAAETSNISLTTCAKKKTLRNLELKTKERFVWPASALSQPSSPFNHCHHVVFVPCENRFANTQQMSSSRCL